MNDYKEGRLILFPPQWYLVYEMIQCQGSIEALVKYARGKKVEPMLPEFTKEGKRFSILPGDREHSTSSSSSSSSTNNGVHRLTYDLDENGNIININFTSDSFQPKL